MVILTFLLNLIIFILVLGIIIVLHELGHFTMAKKFNVLCHEFSIGMGPALFQKKKGETTYSIRAIPIGGYVSIAGEDNDDAFFNVGDTLGLRLDQNDKVKAIVMHEALPYDVIGKVVSFEIFDCDRDELHIELELEDASKVRYLVLEDAKYHYAEKKEMQIATKERSLSQKPKWQRFVVLFAGAFMNFVLALFLFILGYALVGKPVEAAKVKKIDPKGPLAHSVIKNEKDFMIEEINGVTVTNWKKVLEEIQKYPGETINLKIEGKEELINFTTRVDVNMLGISNYNEDDNEVNIEPLVIGKVFGIGNYSDLKAKDKITKINDIPVTNWQELIDQIFTILNVEEVQNVKDIEVTIEYIREGKTGVTKYKKLFPLTTFDGQGAPYSQVYIGVERATKFNLGFAFAAGATKFGNDAITIFRVLGALFTPKTSGISVTDLAGPIGIFNIIAQVREGGFVAIVLFMGFLSVNVGIVNLLPIPALDGGRILFLAIEAVTRKPLNKKVETWANNIAFLLLMGLFVLIMIFDVMKLF